MQELLIVINYFLNYKKQLICKRYNAYQFPTFIVKLLDILVFFSFEKMTISFFLFDFDIFKCLRSVYFLATCLNWDNVRPYTGFLSTQKRHLLDFLGQGHIGNNCGATDCFLLAKDCHWYHYKKFKNVSNYFLKAIKVNWVWRCNSLDYDSVVV